MGGRLQETLGQLAHKEEGFAELGRKLGNIQQAQRCFLAIRGRHLLKPGVEDKSAASTCHTRISGVVKPSRCSSHSRLKQHEALQHMGPTHPSPFFPVSAAARDVSQHIRCADFHRKTDTLLRIIWLTRHNLQDQVSCRQPR